LVSGRRAQSDPS